MAYDSPSTINFTSGTEGLFPYLNKVTNWWFGRAFMITLWTIIVIGYLQIKKDDYFGAFAVAGWVCTVIGMFAWVIGLINGLDLAIVVTISILSTVGLIATRND